jgi:hypothetical protein
MAGLCPGHPRLRFSGNKDADARDKRGHDKRVIQPDWDTL